MKNKLNVIAVGTFILLSLALVSTASAGFFEDYYQESQGNSLDLDKLQEGDLIMLTDLYALDYAMPGHWDHCVMYVGNDEFIAARPDGVKTMSVSTVHNAGEAAIYRVNTTDEVIQGAIDYTMDQIGKPFDYSFLFWPGSKDAHSDEWYCTELIWAGYYVNGVDIDANSGYHYKYWNSVAAQEIADDDDTYRVAHSD